MRGDFRGPAEPTPLTRRGRYDEPDGSDGEALTPRFPHSFIIAFGRQHREARGLRRPAISGTSRGPRSGGPGSLRLGTRFSFRSAESRRVARVLRGWGVDSPLLPRRASRQLSAVSHARAFSRVAGLFGAGAATPGCHAPGFSRRHVVRRKPRRPPIAAPRPRGPGSSGLGTRFSPPLHRIAAGGPGSSRLGRRFSPPPRRIAAGGPGSSGLGTRLFHPPRRIAAGGPGSSGLGRRFSPPPRRIAAGGPGSLRLGRRSSPPPTRPATPTSDNLTGPRGPATPLSHSIQRPQGSLPYLS